LINNFKDTNRVMSHFGDLLGGKIASTPAPAATPPVVEELPKVKKEAAAVSPPTVVSELTAPPLKEQLYKKSKVELEKIGRGIGIELDRRQSHSKLVVQLQAELEKNKVTLD
tara:strand:+ start:2084 stop:2419 length:336 start_codon:yes stop_codon:yes gene_type:complete